MHKVVFLDYPAFRFTAVNKRERSCDLDALDVAHPFALGSFLEIGDATTWSTYACWL